ncbi:YhcH/YjgK/YiaL family protein [bacterium]|nr:YhcH/YjgK/YiaL family protein [bacterium]
MIAAQLADSARYENVVPGLDKAFAWLRANAANPPVDGRYEIDGDRVFALVMQYTTLPREQKIYEGHRRFLDVQFIAGGGPEALYYGPAAEAPEAEAYDATKDFVKFDPAYGKSMVVLRKGEFAIFFPEDAHMPGAMFESPAEVKKIVVKVRLS